MRQKKRYLPDRGPRNAHVNGPLAVEPWLQQNRPHSQACLTPEADPRRRQPDLRSSGKDSALRKEV